MKIDERLVALASRCLGIAVQEAVRNVRPLPGDAAVYIWAAGRGGGAVIVGLDGSVLYANSSVTFDRHLAEFRAGRRTDPAAFPGGRAGFDHGSTE